MHISVIIPTCNRNDLLIQCLDKLDPSFQTICNRYEVIVTDDSAENTAALLIQRHYKWVKWVAGPKKGPAANRNNGARHAIGEWLIFIDDDCLPDKNLLNSYCNEIVKQPGILSFEGAILPDDWGKLNEDLSECPVNDTGGRFWSANICINSALFRQISGFDENFLIAAQEDQDIYLRLLKVTSISFLKDAFVIHPVRRGKLLKKILQISKNVNNWYVFDKKFNRQSTIRTMKTAGALFINYSKGAVSNFLKGKFKESFYYFVFIFSGIPIYLKISISDQYHDKKNNRSTHTDL